MTVEYSELSVERNQRGDIDHFWAVISVSTERSTNKSCVHKGILGPLEFYTHLMSVFEYINKAR